MDFKEASSRLTSGHTLADIAAETQMSEATVRRARLAPESAAYRPPPPGWKQAIIRLAERRIKQLCELIDSLQAGEGSPKPDKVNKPSALTHPD